MRFGSHLRQYLGFLAFVMLIVASLACSAVTLTGNPAQQVGSPIPTFTLLSLSGQPDSAQAVLKTPAGPALETLAAQGTQAAPETQAVPENQAAQNQSQAMETKQSQYLGDTTIQEGFALTAHTVQDPAKPGLLYQSKQGMRLVAVEITVANISRNSLSVNPLNTTLIDTDGNRYPLALAAVDKQLDTIILKKGEKVRGWVAFQVPQDAQPASIEYGTGLLSFNVLQASLIQPPPGYQPDAGQVTSTAITATPEAQTFLGDAVEKHGIAIVPIAVKDPAQPGQFYQAKNDKKLIAVELVVANIQGDGRYINPLDTVLVDAGGFTYKAELGAVDHHLPALTLYPGEHVQGWVAFETPMDARAMSLKYNLQAAGDDFIKAGLQKAPDGRASIPLPASPPQIILPKMGQRVENFGYALTASAVQDPAAPGMLYKKRPGYRLVAVEITLENISGEPMSVNPLYAYLVDAQGFVYEDALGGINQQIEVSTLNAGEKVKGWVAFEIPEGANPASIKYALNPSQKAVLQEALTK